MSDIWPGTNDSSALTNHTPCKKSPANDERDTIAHGGRHLHIAMLLHPQMLLLLIVTCWRWVLYKQHVSLLYASSGNTGVLTTYRVPTEFLRSAYRVATCPIQRLHHVVAWLLLVKLSTTWWCLHNWLRMLGVTCAPLTNNVKCYLRHSYE